MKAFTDYPIVELCDAPGLPAPIREVEILSYDRSLYCEISIEGVEVREYIKAGYLYTKPGRIQEVPCVSRDQLEKLPTIID